VPAAWSQHLECSLFHAHVQELIRRQGTRLHIKPFKNVTLVDRYPLLTYGDLVQTVVETGACLRDAKVMRMTDSERLEFADLIAAHPAAYRRRK
jgi:hypothetical protein